MNDLEMFQALARQIPDLLIQDPSLDWRRFALCTFHRSGEDFRIQYVDPSGAGFTRDFVRVCRDLRDRHVDVHAVWVGGFGGQLSHLDTPQSFQGALLTPDGKVQVVSRSIPDPLPKEIPQEHRDSARFGVMLAVRGEWRTTVREFESLKTMQ